ncbi:cysteine-rich repeat secretory protein 3-like [Cynara cardunculus var. scolymus]|uniref:cysteine-rich repeat secretory protein 3-like n=1 Tax=Cynara cardunculus var. scolymus TaxID=59895 RepID=UPI000D62DB71|nr:cysteine-rich repeat secretory protein 3-like [Cynara cardunculus var. scolymus]
MVLKQRKILHFTPSVLLNLALLIFVSSDSDIVSHYTNFVYKKCRDEARIPQNLVSSLLQELVKKSSETKFYETVMGDDTFSVSGVFQCRMDLTDDHCHTCILNAIPRLSCGSNFLARVQLKGCYLSLQPKPEPKPELDLVHEGGKINGRALVSTTFLQEDYLQHKKCGQRRARFHSWEEVLNAVFEAIVGCVMSSRDGHCVTKLEGVYAMGQCEGSLERCECGKCVNNAFQVARDECRGSDSGEIYLENCFVSFSDNESNEENDVAGGSAKSVAIVVGVGAALALLSAICYCIRSSTRKHDDW